MRKDTDMDLKTIMRKKNITTIREEMITNQTPPKKRKEV